MGFYPFVPAGLPLSGGTLTGGLTVGGVISTTGLNAIQASGDLRAALGNVDVQSAGGGLKVAEGANAKQGVVTLVAGASVVANASVTAVSRILLGVQSLGTVAVASGYAVTARTPGVSFTITASIATDTSVIAYEIFEPG